ncbi:MAG: type II toxin-antitoxin system RelB/DinJ family antitoxin [Rickettsia conorii subsp. raoultii]|uniref:Type II toxin-antitoxin system RelB/DinJ family antitoxin n=1 Tax=Rickettsia conorii subsp. raoultii TaxID=369822 RepID=A0ABY4U317_RICCR|nr:type II toxin-antitoxin system RelB/DinJ family antitoxin [Rickettsia conorii]APZ30037.1 DNA damage-inducible protein J [Rickettsia conorii subsp. raoultii]URW77734.1 type II toxin-antitoxin system RelB/DinJ family antitoxin [Rickettsia conorii subsp. raoultii]
MNTVDIRLRVSADIKIEAEEIFKQMGMTMSEAMRIFLNQCINSGGLPFKPHIKIPNEKTIKTFEDTDKQIGLTISNNTKEMFNKLGT